MAKDENEEKREHAIALQYKNLDELPQVVATGVGDFARQIVSIAKENQIPVQKNSALIGQLSQVRVGEGVSPESFELVAELVSFLFHTDRKWREQHGFLDKVLE